MLRILGRVVGNGSGFAGVVLGLVGYLQGRPGWRLVVGMGVVLEEARQRRRQRLHPSGGGIGCGCRSQWVDLVV